MNRGYLLNQGISSFFTVIRTENKQHLTCTPKAHYSNQTAHSCSISVSIARMKKLCILGYPNCVQRRFGSDCANAQSDLNLRCAHMPDGKFSDVATHILVSYGNTALMTTTVLQKVCLQGIITNKIIVVINTHHDFKC